MRRVSLFLWVVVFGVLARSQGLVLPKWRTHAVVAFFSCCLASQSPVFAADLEAGEKIFDNSCAYCHPGGANVIPFQGGKTLLKDALKLNKVDTAETISALILNGKGQMPAFGPFVSPKGNQMPAKLSPQQIENVADFVLFKAFEKGW